MRGSHPIRVDPIEEIVKPTLHMLAGVSERERSFLEFTSEATNLWKKLDIEGWFGELEVAGEITLSERHRAELCNAITDYEDQLPERVELRRVQIENATKACKSAAEACRVANDALLPLQFSFSRLSTPGSSMTTWRWHCSGWRRV